MKDTEFAYASARIRSAENSLLSYSFLTQLAHTQSRDEAVTLLINNGYSQFEQTNDTDEALSMCISELWEEIKTAVDGKADFDFLIMKNDFHNLKVAIKAILSDNEPDKLFIYPCIIDPSETYELIKSRNFDLIDPMLSEAARRGYKLITETMDAQLLDICADKYYFSELLNRCKDYPLAYEYFSNLLALYDIKTALRLAETKKSSDAVFEAVFDNPIIDATALSSAAKKSVSDVLSFIENTEFAQLADAYRNSHTALECECFKILASVLDKAYLVSFGTEPVFAYFIEKENEINTVRMILNCKAAKIPADKICERMCDVNV